MNPQHPALYIPSQQGLLFNVRVFWVWAVNALLHSVLLFWLPVLMAQHHVLWPSGRDGGYLVLGNFVYTVHYPCTLPLRHILAGNTYRPVSFIVCDIEWLHTYCQHFFIFKIRSYMHHSLNVLLCLSPLSVLSLRHDGSHKWSS